MGRPMKTVFDENGFIFCGSCEEWVSPSSVAKTSSGYYRKYCNSCRSLERYGLTKTDVTRMLEKQNNQCALCCSDFSDRRMAIDHDHNCCPSENTCGQCIRGLLCYRCNTALGSFNDDPEMFRKAISYLEGGGFHR